MEVSLELERQPDASRMTLPRMLADVTSRHADRVALRVHGARGAVARELSYAALRSEAMRLARGLVGAGVGKGTRVALLMGNNPDWVVSAFAVGLAGGVLVPVNTFATPEERAFILRHSDAAVLLLQRELLGKDLLGDLAESHPAIGSGRPGRLRCPELPALRQVFCLGLDTRQGGAQPWTDLIDAGADVDASLVDAIAEEVERYRVAWRDAGRDDPPYITTGFWYSSAKNS